MIWLGFLHLKTVRLCSLEFIYSALSSSSLCIYSPEFFRSAYTNSAPPCFWIVSRPIYFLSGVNAGSWNPFFSIPYPSMQQDAEHSLDHLHLFNSYWLGNTSLESLADSKFCLLNQRGNRIQNSNSFPVFMSLREASQG